MARFNVDFRYYCGSTTNLLKTYNLFEECSISRVMIKDVIVYFYYKQSLNYFQVENAMCVLRYRLRVGHEIYLVNSLQFMVYLFY